MKRAALALLLLAGCKSSSRPPSLDQPVSVEQPGGSAAEIFSQGSELPTSATESFTTAKDAEPRLLLHVLRGTGHAADKLKSEGWWSIDGVAAAKAGQPQVMVTFELDAKGALSVTAREDDRRLSVKKLADGGQLTPSPLTEPDDDEESDEEPD